MVWHRHYLLIPAGILLGILFYSCESKHPASEPQIIEKPAEMNKHVNENIEAVLKYASENNGKINDSIRLNVFPVVEAFYKATDFRNVWSSNEEWLPLADSLFNFISNS